jgi:hypothetical protein
MELIREQWRSSPMIRLLKLTSLFTIACLLPLVALRAQQPPPASTSPGTGQPAATEPLARSDQTKDSKPTSDLIERIKEEGLNRSRVMETLSYLTDVIGPRLTGSPAMKWANEWTRDTLAAWGLENAHLESWGEFGRGWSLTRFSAQVVTPQCIPLIAYPKAWSPGTNGPIVADVVLVEARTEADLARYKGKLKGAIVLTGTARTHTPRFEPLATRHTEQDLLAMAEGRRPSRRGSGSGSGRSGAPSTPEKKEQDRTPAATATDAVNTGSGDSGSRSGGRDASVPGQGRGPRGRGQYDFARKRLRFLLEEGAALQVDTSPQGDGGTIFVTSASVPQPDSTPPSGTGGSRVAPWKKNAPRTLPQIVLASEQYNRLVRMIQQGASPRIEVDLAVQFHEDDTRGYNTIAEIPGTDLKDELVMLGGHMDSWHSGTGATDNAAGVAVAMEAVRILKVLDLKPRRTIRIALWSGEEQDLLGSEGYVAAHFKKGRSSWTGGGGPPGSGSESSSAEDAAPDPEYAKFSAYFNLDHGTGKIRGLYLQGNEAVRPIFREWLQPFRSMDATTLTPSSTSGTDHESFDDVGLPGFQFIQDWMEYHTRTHHSNQDVYDRIHSEDMQQAAVVMAAFVYNTAMRDEKLPRKPARR